MLSSKRGAAILQVLLVAAVLAGISALLLRASISRTSSSHLMSRTVTAQLEIENCMAQINQLWSMKTPEAFTRDMHDCIFYCTGTNKTNFNASCNSGAVREFRCGKMIGKTALPHQVVATIAQDDGKCKITYEIQDAQDL